MFDPDPLDRVENISEYLRGEVDYEDTSSQQQQTRSTNNGGYPIRIFKSVSLFIHSMLSIRKHFHFYALPSLFLLCMASLALHIEQEYNQDQESHFDKPQRIRCLEHNMLITVL